MTTFDHLGNNASPEWLTSVLTKSGFLRSGEVVALKQRVSQIGETLTSDFFFLHEIRYSPNHAGNPPSDCLMKVGKPHLFSAAKHEAAFYDLARKKGSGLLRLR